MSIVTVLAVYFLVWWLVLFAVLPWGVRRQEEEGKVTPGSDPGAPARPMLLIKAVATTLISAVIVAVGFAVWKAEIIPFDRLLMPLALPGY
jgi:predicted secreted protein